MAREGNDGDARSDLAVAVDRLDPVPDREPGWLDAAGLLKRRPMYWQRVSSIRHFPGLNIEGGIREQRVVRAVIPVQVRVDHRAHVAGIDARPLQHPPGLLLRVPFELVRMMLPRPLGIESPRIDDDRAVAAFDEEHDHGARVLASPAGHVCNSGLGHFKKLSYAKRPDPEFHTTVS